MTTIRAFFPKLGHFQFLKKDKDVQKEKFYNIGVFESFAEFTRKCLFWSQFWTCRPRQTRVFFYEFCEILKNNICAEHLERLLLDVSRKIIFVIDPVLGYLAYS